MFEGKRKFIMGMTYLVGMFGLSALIILNMGEANVLSGLSGLAATGTSTAAGLFGVIYGNIKENQAKAANGSRSA